MKGLGLVVDRGEFAPTESDAIPTQVMEELEKLGDRLPPTVHRRLLKSLEELTDQDFQDIKGAELVESILDEYARE